MIALVTPDGVIEFSSLRGAAFYLAYLYQEAPETSVWPVGVDHDQADRIVSEAREALLGSVD